MADIWWKADPRRPRACGGSPTTPSSSSTGAKSAPRLRRFSRVAAVLHGHVQVGPAPAGFSPVLGPVGVGLAVGPAPAGALPSPPRRATGARCRPHACGGPPPADWDGLAPRLSAPRLRGFSDVRLPQRVDRHVGSAPAGVLRPGGPAASLRPVGPAPAGFSDRRAVAGGHRGVGTAPAGVLRRRRRGRSARRGRPRTCGGAPGSSATAAGLRRRFRACGGAPRATQDHLAHLLSAPRPRGCSLSLAYGVGEPAVGPADWQSPSGAAADRNRPGGETPGLGLSRPYLVGRAERAIRRVG